MKYPVINYIPDYRVTPSPETVYIRLETYFVRVLNEFKDNSLDSFERTRKFIWAYREMQNLDFRFQHIIKYYEDIIYDELGYDNIIDFLENKKPIIHLKKINP